MSLTNASGIVNIDWGQLWTDVVNVLIKACALMDCSLSLSLVVGGHSMNRFKQQPLLTGIQIAYAIVVIIIGLIVIWIIGKILGWVFRRMKMDKTVNGWLVTVIKGVLKVILATWVVGILGIDMLTTAGLIAALGLAIGLSIGGLVQNFVAGMIIIVANPFRVGDWVVSSGFEGSVTAIGMCTSTLTSIENKLVVIPNMTLAGNPLVNCSRLPLRRVDFTLSMALSEDVEKVRNLVLDLLKADDRVLADPPTKVHVKELASSSVTLLICPWVNTANAAGITFQFTERIHAAFRRAGIEEPWPAVQVHFAEGGPESAGGVGGGGGGHGRHRGHKAEKAASSAAAEKPKDV